MGLGLPNAVAAIEAGATWIDGTIAGMGRGAGNTQTVGICTSGLCRWWWWWWCGSRGLFGIVRTR
jgi:hypothetical protein